MEIDAAAALRFECVNDMFSVLLDAFSPRELSHRFDQDERVDLEPLGAGAWGTTRLWSGEEVGDAPLTACTGDAGAGLVQDLQRSLAGRTPRTMWVGATGALRHFTSRTSDAAWYGRWRSTATTLDKLLDVYFRWTDDERELEVSFPLSGYPITATRLGLDGTVGDGDAAVAARNRALLLPALGRARRALGLTPAQAAWHLEGDFGWHYPDDEADIQTNWLPRINAV